MSFCSICKHKPNWDWWPTYLWRNVVLAEMSAAIECSNDVKVCCRASSKFWFYLVLLTSTTKYSPLPVFYAVSWLQTQFASTISKVQNYANLGFVYNTISLFFIFWWSKTSFLKYCSRKQLALILRTTDMIYVTKNSWSWNVALYRKIKPLAWWSVEIVWGLTSEPCHQSKTDCQFACLITNQSLVLNSQPRAKLVISLSLPQ